MPYVLPDGQKVKDSDGAKFFSAHADDTISFGPYALGRSSEDFLTLHGITWEDAPAKTVSRADMQKRVNAERDERMKLVTFAGKDYDFDTDSRQNIAGAFARALAAMINGAQPGDYRWDDPDEDFAWIAHDNTSTLMDAQTCLAFGQAAASWKADHIRTARKIKDLDPVPSDYADDNRWPTA